MRAYKIYPILLYATDQITAINQAGSHQCSSSSRLTQAPVMAQGQQTLLLTLEIVQSLTIPKCFHAKVWNSKHLGPLRWNCFGISWSKLCQSTSSYLKRYIWCSLVNKATEVNSYLLPAFSSILFLIHTSRYKPEVPKLI